MGVDEHDLFLWLSTLLWLAQQRYRDRDTAGLLGILKRLEAMHDLASEDPCLSTLETNTAHCIIYLADTHLDELQFTNCIAMCDAAKRILEAKTERYVARGQEPRPDSAAWCSLVTTLGEAKWKGPDEIRDSVLSPEQMITVYRLAEERIRAGLQRYYPQADSRRRNLMESLAWCGMSVTRAAMRHLPDVVAPLRAMLARFHGELFDDRSQPFYWSLLITELFVSDVRDRAALDRCYRELHQLARDRSDRAYENSLRNEKTYLLTHRAY